MNKTWAIIILSAAVVFLAGVFSANSFGRFGASPVAQNTKATTDGGGPAATTTNFLGSAIPATNNLYDLGTPTYSWRNFYVSGTTAFTTLSVTNLTFTAATGNQLGLASGGNIQVNGADAKRTIVLTGAGATSSFTSGAATSTQVELSTNKVNLRMPGFSGSAANYVEWTVVMPDNYDGGSLTGVINFFATSTVDTASSTVWGLQAACTSTGGYLDQAFGTMATTSKQLTAQNQLHTTSPVTFTPTYPAGGSVCQFRLERDATAAADTHTESLGLVAAKVEYGINAYSD